MRNIMVLNPKGGSGKSTIATNLASYYAVEGKQVVLADYDPQGSSLDWLQERSSGRPLIKGVAAHHKGSRLPRGCDVVVIDLPASLYGVELATLLRKAETIIIPVLPSPIDMRAVANFIDTLRKNAHIAKKRAKFAVVANRVRENTNIYHQLESFLKRQKVPMLTHLRDNMNYVRAAERGIGIFELPHYAATTDLEQWQPLLKWLKSKRSQP